MANLAGLYGAGRSLPYTKSNNRIMRQQQAINFLSETNRNSRDSLSISSRARSFSKQSIAALIDKSANVSESELSYYFANYNNPSAILDAINFGEHVSCGYNPDFKDYGAVYFTHNGIRQVVPIYAVPKINANSLPGIHAVNNSLVLKNKSYYSWTGINGSRYAWEVKNGIIGYAQSESLLAENMGTNYMREMGKAGGILSTLAQGRSLWDELYSRKEVLSTCEKVGIKPGFFSIDAGAGKHTYILQESGNVINVDKEINNLNNTNWIRAGYKEGDTFSVFGNEYAIDNSGHIHISVDDTFTSTDVIFPKHSRQ